MRDPHTIIIKPHISEKSVKLSYGDQHVTEEHLIQRSYTFIVAPEANKIEIKRAIETIYNAGKKDKADKIKVDKVRTITVRGKSRRAGRTNKGKTAGFKKAIITLVHGQILEDYGV